MMAEMPREKRLFRALFLGLIALHLALVLSARLYPFTDLPDHLAAATIARHIGEPTNDFARFYRVDAFLKPNTFHLWFCGLALFPSVELANRIFFALYVVLFPLSVLLAVRKLGGNPWYAFLSFPLVYNYSVSWGFAGFAFAVPLAILFCRFFVLDERGVAGPARALGAAAGLALLYFVHVLAALFCLLAVVLRLVGRGRGGRRALVWSIAAALPLAVLVFSWWRGEARGYAGPGLVPFLREYYSAVFVPTFFKRKSVLIFDNYHLFEGVRGYAIAALFSLGILVPAAAALFARKRGAPGLSALLLAALLCCLLLPNELPQQAVLYERFSVLLLIALILFAASRAPARLPRGAAGAFVGLALLHYLLWTGYFFDFNRENAGFDRAFLRPDGSGKTLAGLVVDYTYRGRPTYIHFPSYYIVWEKCAATASLADFRFGAVRRNASTLMLPRYLEWVGKRGNYDGRYRDMDYLLMRGGSVPEGFAIERTAGAWSLCARTEPPKAEESGAPATP
jgi:hypothetical protein